MRRRSTLKAKIKDHSQSLAPRRAIQEWEHTQYEHIDHKQPVNRLVNSHQSESADYKLGKTNTHKRVTNWTEISHITQKHI